MSTTNVGTQQYTPTPQELAAMTGINPNDPATVALLQQMSQAGQQSPVDTANLSAAPASPGASTDLSALAGDPNAGQPKTSSVVPLAVGGAVVGGGVLGALAQHRFNKAYEIAKAAGKAVGEKSGSKWLNPLNWVRGGDAILEKHMAKSVTTAAEGAAQAAGRFVNSADIDSVVRHKEELKGAIDKLVASTSDNGAALRSVASKGGTGTFGGGSTALQQYVDAVIGAHSMAGQINDVTRKDFASRIVTELKGALDSPEGLAEAYNKAALKLGALHQLETGARTNFPATVLDHQDVQLLHALNAPNTGGRTPTYGLASRIQPKLQGIAEHGGDISKLATEAVRDELSAQAGVGSPNLNALTYVLREGGPFANRLPNVASMRTALPGAHSNQQLTRLLSESFNDAQAIRDAADFVQLHGALTHLESSYGAAGTRAGRTHHADLQTAINGAQTGGVFQRTIAKLDDLFAKGSGSGDAAANANAEIERIFDAIRTQHLKPGTTPGTTPGGKPLVDLIN